MWFNHQPHKSPSSDLELQPLAATCFWASSHPQCPQALLTHSVLTHFSLAKLVFPCFPSQGQLHCSPCPMACPAGTVPTPSFSLSPTAQWSPAPSLLSIPLAWLQVRHPPLLLDPHLQPPVLYFVSSHPLPGDLRRSLYTQS